MIGSLLFIAILSFVVWAHHMFVTGMNPFLGSIFMLLTLIIAVPSAVKIFNYVTTLWKGNIRFTPGMLFSIGMVSYFLTGGITGIFLGNSAIDIQLHDTYFVVAHFHLVMGSAAFFGMLAGIYHWFPKMFGRMMNAKLGYVHFWITFIGVYMVFFPLHYIGIAGFPRRYYTWTNFDTFSGFFDLNMLSLSSFSTFSTACSAVQRLLQIHGIRIHSSGRRQGYRNTATGQGRFLLCIAGLTTTVNQELRMTLSRKPFLSLKLRNRICLMKMI
jgi:cytochrome c oxidase subunit 1